MDADYDPLRFAATAIVAAVRNSKELETLEEAKAFVKKVTDMLEEALNKEDEIIETSFEELGLEVPKKFTEVDGYIIDEDVIQGLHNSVEPDNRTILEKIYGIGYTYEKLASEPLNDVPSDDYVEGPYFKVEELCMILDIDIEELAGYVEKDPDDFFDIEMWMRNRKSNPDVFLSKTKSMVTRLVKEIARKKVNPKT